MKETQPEPGRAIAQLAAGSDYFSGLGFEVGHFGAIWHIFKVAQLMATDLSAITGRHGLGVNDFHVLSALMMGDPSPLRATDLAHALNLSNAVLSGRIGKLTALGLIVSEFSGDKRARLLRATATGRDKVRAIAAELEEDGRFIHHWRRLPAPDQEALDRIMRTLHTALDRDFAPSSRGFV